MKMFRIIIALIIVSFALPQYGFAQEEKQDISVLYVGFDGNKPIPENMESIRITGAMSAERFKVEYGKRAPMFKQLLETYFNKVTIVDPRDYKESMSSEHDVTIFDEIPPVIKESVVYRDSITGAYLGADPDEYLSPDYDHPTIFIAHTSAIMGASLGSKLDWYCLCLDKYAHHMKTDHPIFNGPFSTKLTMETRPTPEGILSGFDGGDVPLEIPMWKVDNEGYKDGNGFRIGMVARGWGFEDSPHSEIISSGLCTKQKTAVALGRHGSFFLWGFAGSPEHMTEEAKKVFANSVVYTYQHKDEEIIVRKYNDRIASKEYIKELSYYTTKPFYESHIKFINEFNQNRIDELQAIKAKKAAGETLTRNEERTLSWGPPPPPETREEIIKKYIGRSSWSEITGFDTLKIRAYLADNYDYFYSEPDGFYDIKVDEDIKSLGVANTELAALDKAISLWENKKDVDKARRILLRYTLEEFTTSQEWRTWFENNKDQLFFSEVGGYIWLSKNPKLNPKRRPKNEKDIESLLTKLSN